MWGGHTCERGTRAYNESLEAEPPRGSVQGGASGQRSIEVPLKLKTFCSKLLDAQRKLQVRLILLCKLSNQVPSMTYRPLPIKNSLHLHGDV